MFISIYSAKIEANQGQVSPEPIIDIEGWTVWKQDQLEIYKIIHNLGLTNPERQMHVVATPMDTDTILIISNMESNQFTVSTWKPGAVAKESAFMFIATHRS